MKKELEEKMGLVGVVIGFCLLVMHAIHLPLILLGTAGFGGSVMMNSWWVQGIGAVITIISIVMLVKNKSMKTKIIAGMVIVVGLIALGGFAWSNMVAQMKADTENARLTGEMAGFPCHQMGGAWMGDCVYGEDGEVLFGPDGQPISPQGSVGTMDQQGEIFNTDTNALPEVKETQIVDLQDGDTFELSAGYVKQTIDGKEVRRLAYNGMIPGPTIRTEKGARVTVNFTNNLDINTTVHAHGLRGEDTYDGVPVEMGGKQEPMKPGETFTYQWDFPDTGLFWYHPHIRTDYTTDAGLQGNFWVTQDGYWNDVDREELLVLDDYTPEEPFFITKAVKTLMGRFGTVMLVNNQEDYNLDVTTGETVRFFMTNTANTRTFDVKIADTQIKLVGSDIGRVEQERLVDSIIISPSERYIFESQFSKPGVYKISSRDRDLGIITVSGTAVATKDFSTLQTNTEDVSAIDDVLSELLARPADKRLTIDIDMPSMAGMMMDDSMMGGEHGTEAPHGDEGIEWEDEMAAMNAVSDADSVTWILRDEDTGKENRDINWSFEKDSLTKIEVYNDPRSMHPMQHPLHFHGQKLAVISRNGVHVDSLQWEDTVLLRTGEKAEIVMQATNVGSWLAHCHINEHAESGMKFNFEIK